MNNIKEIKDGFNAGYILKTQSPETYKILEKVLDDVDLPFFNAFIEAGKENSKEINNDKGIEL